MLQIALTFAAMTSIATQFFTDFGGSWTCGNTAYHAQWSVTSPDGDYWTIVQYGIDAQHPGGTAYVGWLPQSSVYVYNDYHNDGSFAQLTAPAPANGVWHWTGKYYAAGSAGVDTSADITWKRSGDRIERSFGQIVGGKRVERGADACTKR